MCFSFMLFSLGKSYIISLAYESSKTLNQRLGKFCFLDS